MRKHWNAQTKNLDEIYRELQRTLYDVGRIGKCGAITEVRCGEIMLLAQPET